MLNHMPNNLISFAWQILFSFSSLTFVAIAIMTAIRIKKLDDYRISGNVQSMLEFFFYILIFIPSIIHGAKIGSILIAPAVLMASATSAHTIANLWHGKNKNV